MKKKHFPAIVAIAVILSFAMVSVSSVAAAQGYSILDTMEEGYSLHEKIDISKITGEIAEPPELTSAASAIATEKEWYEYIYYSDTPVGYYYLSKTTRLSFYDPYDYANSLIMEVDDSLTDWSSSNSLQVSYTTGNSFSDSTGKSTESSTSVQVANGNDVTVTDADDSIVTTKVTGDVETYNYSKEADTTTTTDYGFSMSSSETVKIGNDVFVSGEVTVTENWGHKDTTTEEHDSLGSVDQVKDYTSMGYSKTTDGTTTTTVQTGGASKVTSTIADRTSRATGHTTSSTVSLSTNNSTTITKTYDAGYFNQSGAPLQWKIVKYTVVMPMRYQVEYLIDGEWVFGTSSYCLLNTIQGTCRSWLQNNTAYYEHWGTGEQVTWDEFWGNFFTKESLISAYQNKLYPNQ